MAQVESGVGSGTKASGGQILVAALRNQGVDRIFCVPGESYLPVLDALYDVPEIAVVSAKHEGAAANMAEADGKLTGRPGICFVTRGPGATHASVGRAYGVPGFDADDPVHRPGRRDAKDREGFQEVDFNADVRATGEVGGADRRHGDGCPNTSRAPSRWRSPAAPARWCCRCRRTCCRKCIPPPPQPAAAVATAVAPRGADLASWPRAGRRHRPLIVVGGTGWTSRKLRRAGRFRAQERAAGASPVPPPGPDRQPSRELLRAPRPGHRPAASRRA